ncbi:tetratricopeptide repeat-containing sensor histidine kinase [Hymenobacter metallicola]|uniref:histidine kinase n=1 Tax=Hymenobacter metallicola TaxID=2563114 RepID=A0A4Z0QA29_9BACT|nr:ATP-binding protein [Hymenobacter metallicola]TGE26306.1 hypothetical protein E5K02_16020 [Hymenobacter metallicola]
MHFIKGRYLLFLVVLLLQSQLSEAQHWYWDADYDSLRTVLSGQQADAVRLRTIVHILDVIELTEPKRRLQALPLLEELLQVNSRVKSLDDTPYRLLETGLKRWGLQTKDIRSLEAIKQAVESFDKVGHPIPRLLIDMAPLYNQLEQPKARYQYFQKKLVYYRLQGAAENVAACYLVLGGSYRHMGDYNQAINHYLKAADLFKNFDWMLYTNELMVAGSTYADWGNVDRALYYLRQAQDLETKHAVGGLRKFYTLAALSRLHLQKDHYTVAQQYADLALKAAWQDTVNGRLYVAYGCVDNANILLKTGQLTAALPLLQRAQYLADSMQLMISGRPGELQLDAAWAQYYASTHQYNNAEQYWLTAYQKATKAHLNGLRTKYLAQIIRHYSLRKQSARVQQYTQLYLALADSMSAAQGAYHVAQYEGERLEQAQSAQIANLRQVQAVQAVHLRKRNQLLGGAGLTLVILSGLGGLLYWQLRRNKRTLQQLRQTQNQLVASEKWAFVGELSAGIAHELQNPLSFMKKFAEVSTAMIDSMPQQTTTDGNLEQKILAGLKQNLQEISQHGVRASSIIKDMLEHSRAGTGQRELSQLNELVQEYLRLAYQALLGTEKTLAVQIDTDLDPTLLPVQIVPQDMGRVLLNLFTNALYAVQQRQQLEAEGYIPTVRVSTRQLPEQVEIRVTDNGVGMAESVRTKIFEPFFTTKPAGQGTGLGLSLSIDIVKAHSGTLRVESQLGQGTECIISLPRG